MENSSPSATSQNSQTLFPPNAFNPWLTIAVLIGAPLIAFAIIFGAGIIAIVSGSVSAGGAQAWLFGLPGVQLQIVAEVAGCAFLLAVLPHVAKMPLRDLGFRRLTLSDAGYIAIATIVMVVLTNGTATVLENALHTKVSEQAVALYLNMKTPLAKAQFALLGVVVAALFEETIFRIVLFNAVRKWRGFWIGAIVSGALFGLAHVQSTSPVQVLVLALPLGLGGIVLCAAYAKTGNAYVPIVTHGLFNTVSLVALLFAPQLGK